MLLSGEVLGSFEMATFDEMSCCIDAESESDCESLLLIVLARMGFLNTCNAFQAANNAGEQHSRQFEAPCSVIMTPEIRDAIIHCKSVCHTVDLLVANKAASAVILCGPIIVSKHSQAQADPADEKGPEAGDQEPGIEDLTSQNKICQTHFVLSCVRSYVRMRGLRRVAAVNLAADQKAVIDGLARDDVEFLALHRPITSLEEVDAENKIPDPNTRETDELSMALKIFQPDLIFVVYDAHSRHKVSISSTANLPGAGDQRAEQASWEKLCRLASQLAKNAKELCNSNIIYLEAPTGAAASSSTYRDLEWLQHIRTTGSILEGALLGCTHVDEDMTEDDGCAWASFLPWPMPFLCTSPDRNDIAELFSRSQGAFPDELENLETIAFETLRGSPKSSSDAERIQQASLRQASKEFPDSLEGEQISEADRKELTEDNV